MQLCLYTGRVTALRDGRPSDSASPPDSAFGSVADQSATLLNLCRGMAVLSWISHVFWRSLFFGVPLAGRNVGLKKPGTRGSATAKPVSAGMAFRAERAFQQLSSYLSPPQLSSSGSIVSNSAYLTHFHIFSVSDLRGRTELEQQRR
ncbi:unnamed protein product [Soboliphyme baturini]|uniref:Transmembrane protein n=1 Tax=Soboliphyme baturini TaxID=241478 RepID=A0A183J293_9BILA|nr:unnamed protein product [Soboliphyme baturini]